jgi:hypothetical protein
MSILTKKEINSLRLSNEQKEHLERHFRYSTTTGSKFHDSFAKTPEQLLDKIKKHLLSCKAKYKWDKGKCEISIFFDYPIGTDSIISINLIPESIIKKINKIQRSPENDYKINIISEIDPIATNQLNMILSKTDLELQILTIFPGVLTPPLPNLKYHSKKQYTTYDNFWRKYVFISTK